VNVVNEVYETSTKLKKGRMLVLHILRKEAFLKRLLEILI